MPADKLKQLWEKISGRLIFIKDIKRPTFHLASLKTAVDSWWRLMTLFFAIFIILYYALGAIISHRINTRTDYEIIANSGQSSAITAMAFLVDREINQHLWTPNLPFIFPAILLDNMPAFQSGIISAIGNVTSSLSKCGLFPATDRKNHPLSKASHFLNYPPDIWMFSPQNKLVPAPSSTSQYRRGRRHLLAANEQLGEGLDIFRVSTDNLACILKRAEKDLSKSSLLLEAHIRENSSAFLDNKADDLFFYQQGKLYAYLIIFKALGNDGKEIIVREDAYQNWTRMLNNLQKAAALNPSVIRNGTPDSSLAPNHLMVIDNYTLRAVINLKNIIAQLKKFSETSR